MTETLCMYRLKPICGLQTRVELPKCMYRLRQIQGSFDATDVMHDNILAKSSIIEEQDNFPAVRTLEQRQETILTQLRNLKRLVEELSRQLRVPSAASTPQDGRMCMKPVQEKVLKETLQLVVKASPCRLPHALLAVIRCSFSKEGTTKIKPGTIEVKWYSHSTLSGPLPTVPCGSQQECNPHIRITFIWKDVVKGVEFSLGNSSVWLRGEALLMHVIMSHLSCTIPSCEENILHDVALSALLDSCAAVSELTKSSSSTCLKQTLAEACKWFSCLDVIPSNSHSMSVGEIALWGALKSLCWGSNDGTLPPETPAKLNAWFTSYSRFLC